MNLSVFLLVAWFSIGAIGITLCWCGSLIKQTYDRRPCDRWNWFMPPFMTALFLLSGAGPMALMFGYIDFRNSLSQRNAWRKSNG